MCQVFGQLPSTYARRLLPELAHLSELDWYALDVAAAWYVREAEAKANRDAMDEVEDQQGTRHRKGKGKGEREPDAITRRLDAYRNRQGAEDDLGEAVGHPGVLESGDGRLAISGKRLGETPPWER